MNPARPQLDDRDPQPPAEWRPVSSEWRRKQALDACREAVNKARDDRKKPTNEESA